jgi:hypothetical protein
MEPTWTSAGIDGTVGKPEATEFLPRTCITQPVNTLSWQQH